ncbi:MAG: TonB-dependent receptor, partial [Bacteroidetes bacterium]|nr:TonB-dependent receptor [Bacteroidota bacterium]
QLISIVIMPNSLQPKKLFFSIIFFLAITKIIAQSSEIRGFVYNKQNGEPASFTTVVLTGTDKASLTDVNGFYNFSKLTPGKYSILFYAMGFDSVRINIDLPAGKKVSKNVYLNPSAVETKQVEIVGEKIEQKTRVGVSKVVITPKDIEKIPSVGGQPDLAQYLQVLPGVVFTGDQGGQLYIRGGAPIQNKVILDGMTIYNPFHSIGLFSVFDVDYIRSIDVYTGGYNAEYGGRISAIMDITTRDGNRDHISGKLGLSPFTGKFLIEGPLKKMDTIAGGGVSFLLSGRSSYLKETSPVFYGYAGKDGLPYDFNDLYGKVTLSSPGGSKLSLFGFNFTDNVDFKSATKYNWKSQGVGSKFILIPGESSTLVEGHFAYSNYEVTQTELDNKPRFSQINGFEAGADFSYYPNKDLLKYGFAVNGFKTDFSFTNSVNAKVQQQEFTTELSGYVRYNKVMGRLILDPGFRLHYYASEQCVYTQNLMSAQSDQDVVNLFYGFLSSPNGLPATMNGRTITNALQSAKHYIAGFEYDLLRNTTFEAEAYLKDFTQLTNINRNKIFDNLPQFQDKPEYYRSDYLVETGQAYGADFKLSYDKKPYYLWVVYSYGKVTRNDGKVDYNPHWDRRHTINILGSTQFGKNLSWETSVRWSYGSGFPFTKTQGYYDLYDFQNGIGTNYTTANANLGILYGPLNGGRLSDYHRMDVSLTKHLKFSHNQLMKIVLSVTNIYNRDNVFYFDRIRYIRVNQLPILPSLAINYSF